MDKGNLGLIAGKKVSPVITPATRPRVFPDFSVGRRESKQSLNVLLIEKTDLERC